MDFLVRIASLVRKELLAVLRDKKSRLALIIPPIIQIAIFGYAATMNVTRVCLLYTSPSPRDQRGSRMPSSA